MKEKVTTSQEVDQLPDDQRILLDNLSLIHDKISGKIDEHSHASLLLDSGKRKNLLKNMDAIIVNLAQLSMTTGWDQAAVLLVWALTSNRSFSDIVSRAKPSKLSVGMVEAVIMGRSDVPDHKSFLKYLATLNPSMLIALVREFPQTAKFFSGFERGANALLRKS